MEQGASYDEKASRALCEAFGFTPAAQARQLPPLFDDRCEKCSEKPHMERMPEMCWTRVRPFAIFQCPNCKARLLLYDSDAPNRPLFVWTGDPGIATERHLNERIAERERNDQQRKLRSGEALEFSAKAGP